MGSTAVYIVFSALAFGRRIIEAGTTYVTVPGLWLLAIDSVTAAGMPPQRVQTKNSTTPEAKR